MVTADRAGMLLGSGQGSKHRAVTAGTVVAESSLTEEIDATLDHRCAGKNGHVWSGALNVELTGELRLVAPQRCFPLRRQHAGSDRSEDAKTGAVSKKPKTTVSNIATVRRIRVILSGLFVWARAPESS